MIVLSGASGPVRRTTCDTLDDARRTARRLAQQSTPCALIVCNAYHRVIDSSVVTGDQVPRRRGGAERRATLC